MKTKHKPDNPPAFPKPDSPGRKGDVGMDLRDYFAGQALTGLLAACFPYKQAVTMAYQIADQMLEEREK